VRIGDAEHPCFVDPFYLVTRVGEPDGKIAVVGEDQQPFGVKIEATDRVNIFPYPFE